MLEPAERLVDEPLASSSSPKAERMSPGAEPRLRRAVETASPDRSIAFPAGVARSCANINYLAHLAR